MRICPHRNAESTSKSEVSKFEVIMLVNQKILRLEVSVQYAMRMAVQQSRSQLMCEFLKSEHISAFS